MVANSKESFSFSAIGKFVGPRPSLEGLEQWVQSSWRLSRPCLISFIERGFFLFRFNTKEDRDCLVRQSPLLLEKKKLLQHWSLGQEVSSWPAISPVWICLKGIPYRCWSSDILLSIAGSISKPLHLDEITAYQKMLSFARVLVNLDVAKPNLTSVIVDLEGDGAVEVEVLYENIPYIDCLSTGHLSSKCPFTSKPPLLKTPTIAIQPLVVAIVLGDKKMNSLPMAHPASNSSGFASIPLIAPTKWWTQDFRLGGAKLLLEFFHININKRENVFHLNRRKIFNYIN
eukprot:TRINITY_DN11050_c0_g1_i1.p1 TRINITY_DN11050_c0_g1~~TRINITY_DN11050_c0_g1_i1.p1  ORF type:complete len:286 (+),score=11.78 TRINITY_DN11050_c0_g1_i1:3142-3999(+)